MQLFTAVPLSGDAQAKDWGRPKALALRTILGWGSLNCGESASGTKGSRQKFPQVPGGMKDAVWGGGNICRRAGSTRRSPESNFYTVFCNGEVEIRDLMGVWAEVGKMPSCMVTQGQGLE